jgi:putative FmdB family regulatory protein
MPTYEYACGACGHQWEQVQRIVEAPIEVCPQCAQSSAHRLISGGTNFILKGGGWYSDLYSSKKAPEKPAEKASESTASTGASESGTKAESKTETKSAPAASPATPAASSTPSTSSPSSNS